MQRGFTLIELMVTVAIVAILAGFAVPAVKDYLATGAIRSAASDFYGSLLAARSEAIKRRTTATVEPLTSGGAWSTGWKVVVGGNTFQQVDALRTDISVLSSAAAGTAVSYGSNGRVSAGQQTVTFYSPTQTKVAARCVGVDTNGLPRVRTDSNNVASDGCN